MIHSYRDLPVLMTSGTRGALGMATTLFSAHARIFIGRKPDGACAPEELKRNTSDAGNLRDFAINDGGNSSDSRQESDAEKFAGPTYLSIEAMMGDGKALPIRTSHFLGRILPQASSQYWTRTPIEALLTTRGNFPHASWCDYHGSRRRSGADSATELAPISRHRAHLQDR